MSRPLRFLLIASFADSLLNFRGALIDSLVAAGFEVHVAAPGILTDMAVMDSLAGRGAVAHDIPLRRTGMNPVQDITLLIHLFALMRRIRPAFVLAYTIKPVIYGMISAKFSGVSKKFALITGLGYAFQAGAGRKGVLLLVQKLYAFALGNADKVFFQNPDDESVFRKRGLVPASVPTCVVNGSGVDVSAFRLSSLPDRPRFLLIARLLGDKGVREYAEAARQIRARYPGVVCSLVGWVDDNPDSIKQSELDAWVSDGEIDYIGRLKDVRPAIAECSVYVLPSYREGTPRTVLEAMAMGRAIITTDAPGCRETVVDGENGILVPVRSVESLVRAMAMFIDQPDLAARMGLRSRQIAEEKYDVHRVNGVMLREMGIQ